MIHHIRRLSVGLIFGVMLPTAGAVDDLDVATGQFVTVSSPIDDVVYNRVSNAAAKLQNEAQQAGRKAVLVLQISPGASQFHQVQGLAKLLTSPQMSQVTTVAWIPENLTGPHVLVALACREIVMPGDVQLGDISRGGRLDADEEQAVLAIAQKRTNPKVNPSLVRALFDPQQSLYRIRVQTADVPAENRVVSQTELDELRQSKAVIEDAVALKEAGSAGLFTGKAARGGDILVTHLAEDRTAVAEIYGLDRDSQREPIAKDEGNRVRLIRIQQTIDAMLQSFLVRQIHQAAAEGVQLLIIELQSPGGQLLPSIELAFAIAELDPQRMRTVAYIPENAMSGAAVVAMACDDVFLLPNARWGNATPANPREAARFERSPDKVTQLKGALKTLAEKKGRPAALAMAMADRSAIVYQTTHAENGRSWFHTMEELHAARGEWNEGPVLVDADGTKSFVVEGRRATELKLAEPPVESFDELKTRLGVPAAAKINTALPTWVDQLVFTLNSPVATMLLLVLAVAFMYLELHFSTTIMALLSVLCFALFFWSKFLGGTAGWLEVMLFVFGAVCLAIEAFVVPGFGVFGISGILMIVASLVMASQTFGNLEPSADVNQFASALGVVLAALVAMGFVGAGLSQVLPRIPFFEGLILAPPGSAEDGSAEPRLRIENETDDPSASVPAAVGLRGVALSVLRPSGKAQFGDRVLDVISDGPFVPTGSPIEIVSANRLRIVVRQLDEATQAT